MSNTQRPIYYNFVNDNSTPLVIDIETFDPWSKRYWIIELQRSF